MLNKVPDHFQYMVDYFADVIFDENERIYCKEVINNGQGLTITVEKGDAYQRIIGFSFKFEYSTIDWERDSTKVSFDLDRIVNYYFDFLTALTFHFAQKGYYQMKIHDLNGNHVGTCNMDVLRPVLPLNTIDLSKYQKIISNMKMGKIIEVRNFYGGVVLLFSNFPDFAIREFYKILEGRVNDNDIFHVKFSDCKILRDLFSHNPNILESASKKFMNSDLEKTLKYNKMNNVIVVNAYDQFNRGELILIAKKLMEKAREIVF